MEPILKSHFVNFKKDFEIETHEKPAEEASAFERFVNYVLLSLDYGDVFVADAELLDLVSVGGADDTFIDGIAVAINDRLVRNREEIDEIADSSRKLNIEFVLVQSKMQSGFEISELDNFGTGVKHFFSEKALPENPKISQLRDIKNHIYSEKVISKLQKNPSLRLYYVGTGTPPANDHFSAIQGIIRDKLAECYFEEVDLNVVGGKQLIKSCQELANNFEVQIEIKDIFPLSVDPKADVKKAYAFTCGAREFLKILTKEDGQLRRSLFNDNVRDYLGNQGAINREIEETVASSPEMFLLCNNGITIVCSGFDQIRDKLVRVENPQIVNGCQTSNAIFGLRDHSNTEKLSLLVRVICTENHEVSNRIVRGTNRQNQVLEEAFEATLPFHRDVLEPFFAAYGGDVKLYYERRARQYNNDPIVKKTHVVNLRILTQTFVGMFLDAPHESHRHEAKLLERYAAENESRKIFRDDHSPMPYFVCALTSHMFERYLRQGKIEKRYWTYKAHLFLIFRHIARQRPPRLTKSKALDAYCEKILEMLREPEFGQQIKAVVDVFDTTLRLWTTAKGESRFGIKDRKEFTDLLLQQAARRFAHGEPVRERPESSNVCEGEILRINWRNGLWYGFIKRGFEYENVYFDSRSYSGEPSELVPNRRVKFVMVKGERGLFARNVSFPMETAGGAQ
jgi:cold shock CspA family protein